MCSVLLLFSVWYTWNQKRIGRNEKQISSVVRECHANASRMYQQAHEVTSQHRTCRISLGYNIFHELPVANGESTWAKKPTKTDLRVLCVQMRYCLRAVCKSDFKIVLAVMNWSIATLLLPLSVVQLQCTRVDVRNVVSTVNCIVNIPSECGRNADDEFHIKKNKVATFCENVDVNAKCG